jgi:hypothetical protein
MRIYTSLVLSLLIVISLLELLYTHLGFILSKVFY